MAPTKDTQNGARTQAADVRAAAVRPAARPASGPPLASNPAPPQPPAGAPAVRPPTAPAVRVAAAGPAVPCPAVFASLLPGAATRPAWAPVPGTPPGGEAPAAPAAPRASEDVPPATAVLDDEPILVVDDFPAGSPLIPESAKPFFARSISLRYDTAAVGASLGVIVIAVAFFLGRASVGSVSEKPRAIPPAAPVASSLAERPEIPAARAPVEAPMGPHAPLTTPPPLATAAEIEARGLDSTPAAGPAPAASGAPENARWWIVVLQKGTKEGAEDVKKLLESKDLLVTLDRSGDRWSVYVGGYAERGSPELERDLAKVQKIPPYKGCVFSGAYPAPVKRNQ